MGPTLIGEPELDIDMVRSVFIFIKAEGNFDLPLVTLPYALLESSKEILESRP